MITDEQIEKGAMALQEAFPTLSKDFYAAVVPQGRSDRPGGR